MYGILIDQRSQHPDKLNVNANDFKSEFYCKINFNKDLPIPSTWLSLAQSSLLDDGIDIQIIKYRWGLQLFKHWPFALTRFAETEGSTSQLILLPQMQQRTNSVTGWSSSFKAEWYYRLNSVDIILFCSFVYTLKSSPFKF